MTHQPHNSIDDIFKKSLQNYPERCAIKYRQSEFSYKELDILIQRAIHIIKRQGNGNRKRLAIVGNNHPAYIIAFFAAQHLNMPTVEVSRNENINILKKVCMDTESFYLVTDRDDLKTELHHSLCVDSYDEFLRKCDVHIAKHNSPTEDKEKNRTDLEASIIYTSGTTGAPKGVILSHGNFIFVSTAVKNYLKLSKDDIYGLILPLCHTYGKTVMLTTFMAGAKLLILDNFQNPKNFVEELIAEECSILSAVPYHAHILIKWGNLSNLSLKNLRALTFSGNKLPVSTIEKFTQYCPKTKIYSMYGLTESTTRACYVPPGRLKDKLDSCGKPLPGVKIRVVDEKGRTVKHGQIGEIFLKGLNVMRGYFLDPEATKNTIIDGWLRTGDIGKVDEEGYLYLLGRKKDIIKCAGERISPFEIEEILSEHPGVKDVAVVGSPDQILGEIVQAFIVPENDHIKEGELKSYCANRLSYHKIPRQYTFIDHLDKTATGKTKKHLLVGN